MKTIKIKKGQNKTSLKSLAITLGVSIAKVRNAKEQIENQYDCPAYMVWSTNHQGKKIYNVERFAKIVGVDFEYLPEEKSSITSLKNEKYKEILKTHGKKAASEFWLKG